MSHARTQIRAAVISQLTGLTVTGANVYEAPVYALPDNVDAALTVVTTSESLIDETLSNAQTRDCVVDVGVHVRGASGAYEALIDTVCADVEAAMNGDPTLGGVAKFARYEGTEIEYAEPGEKPIGKAVLRYVVTYRVAADDPETIIA